MSNQNSASYTIPTKATIEAIQAIQATKSHELEYYLKTLDQRMSETGAGSVYTQFANVDELEIAILSTQWERYEHPSIKEGCVGFKTNIPGHLGIVELKNLDPDTKVIFEDRKNTGYASATVKGVMGPEVPFTVMVAGMEKDIFMMFTFHPGEPVSPSKIEIKDLNGVESTVSEAIKMGFTTAKITK